MAPTLNLWRALRLSGWVLTVVLALVLALVSCGPSSVEPDASPSTPSPSTPSPSPPSNSTADDLASPPSTGVTAQPNLPPPASDQAEAPETVPVIIYRVNSACTDYVTDTVQVEANQALQQAVNQILSAQVQAEFDLVGFRVNVDTEAEIATIDLRLAPNSSRQFVSLSACEQMALFGSLRQTILQNTQWQIQTVLFKHQGETIVL